MTLVSKNGLSFIELFAIEFEIRREGPLHLTELLERSLFGPVTGHLEVAFTCDGNLDFVSLFEIERFDQRSGKTHSQTVAPFGNLHRRYTYAIVYPYKTWKQPSVILTIRAIEVLSTPFQTGTILTRAAEAGIKPRVGKMAPARTLQKPSINTPAETDPCFIGVFHTLNQRLAQLCH